MGQRREAWGHRHQAWGNAFETWGKAFEAWGNTNRLSGRCWNGSSATIQAWFVSSEASARGSGAGVPYPRLWNAMDQAWLTLVQARDVLTQARSSLVEARLVSYET